MTNKEIYQAANNLHPVTPTEFWRRQRESGLSPEKYFSWWKNFYSRKKDSAQVMREYWAGRFRDLEEDWSTKI